MYHSRFTTAVHNIILKAENQIPLKVSIVIFLLYDPPHVAENIYKFLLPKNEYRLKH